MLSITIPISFGLSMACLAYVLSVFATFFCSTMSHIVSSKEWLDRFRAWDQAMIYAMISGTYTPIIYQFADDPVRIPLLVAVWLAAATGIITKLFIRHRIYSIGTISYLLLGWLPSIPLISNVPGLLGWAMIGGGVLYSIGVFVLMNDHKARYLHAVWHILVIAAASCHCIGIFEFVVRANVPA